MRFQKSRIIQDEFKTVIILEHGMVLQVNYSSNIKNGLFKKRKPLLYCTLWQFEPSKFSINGIQSKNFSLVGCGDSAKWIRNWNKLNKIITSFISAWNVARANYISEEDLRLLLIDIKNICEYYPHYTLRLSETTEQFFDESFRGSPPIGKILSNFTYNKSLPDKPEDWFSCYYKLNNILAEL